MFKNKRINLENFNCIFVKHFFLFKLYKIINLRHVKSSGSEMKLIESGIFIRGALKNRR